MEEADARAVLGLSSGAKDSEIEAAYRARVTDLRERFDQAADSRTRNRLERELTALEEAHQALLSSVKDPTETAIPDDLGQSTQGQIGAGISTHPLDESSDSTVNEREAATETLFDPIDRSLISVPPKTTSEAEATRPVSSTFSSSPPPLPSPVTGNPDQSTQSWQPPTISATPPIPQSPASRSWYNRWLLLAIGGSVFGLACVLVVFWWLSHLDKHAVSGKDLAQASPSIQKTTPPATPSVTPAVTATPVPTPTAVPTTTPGPQQTPVASTTPSATQTPSTSKASPSATALTKSEIDATRAEVIKRINAVPEYTAEQKTLLIQKMEKARSMERLAVVRFGVGETTVERAAADELVKIFNTPAMQTKLADKTVILIVAGYADTGGRAETNLTLSRERADAVASVLKWRLKLTNAIQTIGMGGTELLSNGRPDQNRAVEVWSVNPI